MTVKASYFYLISLVLLFSFACSDSMLQEQAVDADPESFQPSDEPSALIQSSNMAEWRVIELPEGASSITDLEQHNGVLYAVLDGMGTWTYHNGVWQKQAPKAIRYGNADIEITESGALYALHHRILWRLEGENWVKLPFDKQLNHLVYGGNGLFYMLERKQNNKVYCYDTNTQQFIDLNFPYSVDSKPHVKLESDAEGNLWYLTNYSGLYKYTRGTNSWKKIESRRKDGSLVAYNWSSGLGKSADGSIYYTREYAKTTQIMQVYRANEQDRLDLIHSDVGYGANGVPVGNDGEDIIFFNGARFGQFVVYGNRKYDLPSNTSDLGLSENQLKGVGQHAFTAVGNTLYTTQKWKVDNQSYFRFLALDLDLDGLPYYSSELRTQAKKVVAPAVLAKSPMEVIHLVNGNAAIAFNPVGTNGGVLEVHSAAGNMLQRFELNSKVFDIATNGKHIAIATQKAIEVIDPESEQFQWKVDYESDKKRISMGSNGTVIALLSNSRLALYSNQGEQLHADELNRSYIEDVAINEELERFYIVGYDNKRLPSGNPVQVAFLNAFNFQGAFIWQRFGFDGAALSGNIADTRLYRVTFGEDGALYILGESAGSKTIFRYNGQEFDGSDMLTKIDHHNNLWDTGSAHISYHARVDAINGRILKSQLNMTRLSSGKSNTLRAGDITATRNGFSILGGTASYTIANRDAIRVDGDLLPTYSGADPSVMVLYPNFNQRRFWVSWHRDESGNGSVRSVSAFENQVYTLTEGEDGRVWLHHFDVDQ